jgi:hypothetical protein
VSLLPHCALCHHVTRCRRRWFGGGRMSGRFCSDCLPLVLAADVQGAVQVVEREFSERFETLRMVA